MSLSILRKISLLSIRIIMFVSISIRLLLIASFGSLVLTFECGKSSGKSIKYPWVANIRTGLEERSSAHCAGTLIDDKHVLTSATCLHVFGKLMPAKDITVYFGSIYAFSDDTTPYNVQSYKVGDNFSYYSKTKTNDIAVLTLEKPVQFSDSISPICLPNSDQGLDKFTVAGWPMNEKRKRISDKLIETNVQLLTPGRCFRKREINNALTIHPIQMVDWRIKSTGAERLSESQMCADEIENSSEVCLVDVGGPLMHKKSDDRWTLVGIASDSWGGCSDPEFNGAIYTRVASFKDLIRGIAPSSSWV